MKIEVLKLSNYVRPEIRESAYKEWVENGEKNKMYTDIIDAYYGSPTNSAIIDSYAKLAYGLGLNVEQNYISKKDLKSVFFDFVLFGEASAEVLPSGRILHVPKQKILPSKAVNGEILSFWYCEDWSKTNKYEPREIQAFKGKSKKNQIFIFKNYQVGQFYFSNPSYISAIPYCKVEQELSNYYVNHIQRGLSFGHIINVVGVPESEEEKENFKRNIINQLTGSENAGNFLISFNENKEMETTIQALEVSEAHKQYEFLTQEAQNKICIAHKVVSGAILGIKEATGFSSNAEQIETAFNETMLNVITPVQEVVIEGIEEITGLRGLEIIPLRKSMKDEAQSGTSVQMKKEIVDLFTDDLIAMGEDVNEDEWEQIDVRAVVGIPEDINIKLELAKTFSSSWKAKSEQDTDLFKVRYRYAGKDTGERDFCKKMLSAGKVYRKEDIELAETKVVNPGLGKRGADTYSIWLYKGGVNCKHFWERVIYLRKDNKKISVNEARKMINELDPKDRKDAKWEQNDKLVAQPAQESNNYFKYLGE